MGFIGRLLQREEIDYKEQCRKKDVALLRTTKCWHEDLQRLTKLKAEVKQLQEENNHIISAIRYLIAEAEEYKTNVHKTTGYVHEAILGNIWIDCAIKNAKAQAGEEVK